MELHEASEQRGSLKNVGVLIFRNDEEEVLLVKHLNGSQNGEGMYGLPAGVIEAGESPREAAIRELSEETGLVASEESLSHFEGNSFGAELIRYDKEKIKDPVVRHGRMDVYVCKDFQGELRGENKKTTPEWVKVSDLKDKHLMPNIDLAVENYIASKSVST